MKHYLILIVLLSVYQSYFIAEIIYQNHFFDKKIYGLWYVYATTDFSNKECLTFNFTKNLLKINLDFSYQTNQIPYYQNYQIKPLSKNNYSLSQNNTLNIIYHNSETLFLQLNNYKYILLNKEHITCEYHMIFIKFMLTMHHDSLNKYNLIKQIYC